MILPFIVPDLELGSRMTRVLLLLEFLSHNRSGNLILSVEKIAVFDFFLQHAYILHSVLKGNGKKILFSLSQEDLNSINKEYPNTSGLYLYKELKNLLQILIVYGFITVELNSDKEAMYSITETGKVLINEVSSEYTERLEEICHAIMPLQSESFRNLMIYIKPYINGK
jgi:hypothetical protein